MGLICSFGQDPHEFFWAFALGVVGFLWLKDYRFQTGFLFGLGYWTGVLYWIIFAFDVYDMRRLGIASVFGLCVYLALYKGLVCFLAGKSPFPKFAFCVLWVVCEAIQGHFFQFAFPWGYAAFIWPSLEILQSVVWIGVYGLSFVTLLIFVGFFFGKRWIKALALSCLGGMWIAGYQRLKNNPTMLSSIHLRLVQPCIAQKDKHNEALFYQHLDRHFDLSNLPEAKPLSAILWPETAFFSWMSQDMARFLSDRLTQHPNAFLITGALHRNGDLFSFVQPESPKGCVFNSLFVIKKSFIVEHYDKQHLVPFGEYNPFPFWGGFDAFTAGKREKIITLSSLPPFRPLICFEAIFPLVVTQEKWRLNLTNEAWYGDSPGPYQHLKIAQIRTIEAGVPLVRVGNTGVSCALDKMGRILWKLKLNHVGAIDFQLPL